MNATIILLSGQEVDLLQWQRMYNLTPGSSKIGRFFDIGERNFNDGLKISEAIIRLLDVIRVIRNKRTHINSLDRSFTDQQDLIKKGYRAAKTSPHVIKLAADIDTIDDDDTNDLLECIDEAVEILGYGVRIGWKSYKKDGSTFVHIDVCPMYYGPGKIWNEKDHPKVWENVIEW